MTSLDTLLDLDDALPIQHKPQESPLLETPEEFLESFHRISEKLPNNAFLESLKPYWGDLEKALSVITGGADIPDTGWRLRFEKPRKPTPSEIEERVVLFMMDALEKIPQIPEVDEDQEVSETDEKLSEAETELLQLTTCTTRLFKQRPRLLTVADQSEISKLRKAAIEYTR
jgi:hypothetical protein